jgi:hypothetical protein
MSFLNMIQRGNIQRIKELHNIGQRSDAIVAKFGEYGELDELDRVALPKSAVTSLEVEINNLASGLLPA